MKLACRITAVLLLVLVAVPAVSPGSTLDDHYLARFHKVYGKSVQAVVTQPTNTVVALSAERCLTPLHHEARRDWKQLQSSTQTALAQYLAKPVLTGEGQHVSPAGHFLIHYATTGGDAPDLTDQDGNGIPDWVETVASTFDHVYATETGMGYKPALTTTGAPYDIYLKSLSANGEYGVTESDPPVSGVASTSFIVIDKGFTAAIYHPETYPPIQSLQITAAHEYHHAIQYSYNYFFDIWYAEATATWMEDEVYDNVNQLYAYLPSYLANSTGSLDIQDNDYGKWLFNRFLAEKYTSIAVLNYWEKLATVTSTGQDIPAIPILSDTIKSLSGDLASDFFAFAKKVYRMDWTSHGSDFIDPSVKKDASYVPLSTQATILPHYSFAYYRFLPNQGPQDLVFSFNKSSGIAAVAFKKDVSGAITEYAFTPSSSTITVNGFGSPGTREVALLVCNPTVSDGLSASFTTNGPQIALPATTTTASPTGGGGGGCFIATAAYGSYLHPKVMILRQFRDRYLLTNAPGRAFVRIYYTVSPPIAEIISRHELLRLICRVLLTPLLYAVEFPLISFLFIISPCACFSRGSLGIRRKPTSPS